MTPAPAKEEAPFLELTYHYVHTRRVEGENVEHKTPLVPRAEGDLRVTLGPRIVDIVEDGRHRVFDFERGRVHSIDVEAGTYVETLLVSHAANLDMEMRHRLRMAKTLDAAGQADPSLAPVELACLLGWSSGADEAPTKLTAWEGTGQLTLDERVLVRWTRSEHVLPKRLRGAYARFLHYCAQPHPAARAAMAEQPTLAAEFRKDYRDVGTRAEFVLTLTAVRPTATPPQSAEGLTRVFGDSAVANLAKRVLQPEADDPLERLDEKWFTTFSAAAEKRGDYEDAFLLLMEYGLQSGVQLLDEVRALLTNGSAVAALRPLLGTFGGRDAERALNVLDSVDREHLTHPYIVDVFRANWFTQLKRGKEARDLFLTVLGQAPWLTAAHNDLGDLYVAEFNTGLAWLCYEIGRSIAPEHSTWADLEGFEKHLRRKFAEIL